MDIPAIKVFSSAVHVGEDLVGAANGRRDDLSVITPQESLHFRKNCTSDFRLSEVQKG